MPISRGLVVGRLVLLWLGSCWVTCSSVGSGGPLGWFAFLFVGFYFFVVEFLVFLFQVPFGLFSRPFHPYPNLCVSPCRGLAGFERVGVFVEEGCARFLSCWSVVPFSEA